MSFFITALVRGELNEAWKWSDEPEQKDPENSANGTAVGPEAVKEAAQDSNSPLATDNAEESIAAEEVHEQEEGKSKRKRTKKKN